MSSDGENVDYNFSLAECFVNIRVADSDNSHLVNTKVVIMLASVSV